MAGAFEDYQSKRGPYRDDGSVAVEGAYGKEKDGQLDRARQAMLAGFPGLAPTDAIGYIGQERRLPRVTGETADAYAERLRTCWDGLDGWSYAGSHGSLLRALERAGLPMGDPDGCHIIQRTKRYSWLDGADVVFAEHDGWTFNTQPPAIWNQFGLLFGADVADLDVDTPLADTLNLTVRLWKPAKARFMGTWVVVSGPTWGWPIGVAWGDLGRDWGGGVTRYIPPR